VQVTLFDVQQRLVLGELATPFIKYVVWNADMSMVALLSKHAIVIADKKLGNAQTVHETIRVKSAAWDDQGVLVYSTLNHIKYCLPNGDAGIIRTLELPLYISRVAGGVVHALDREGKARQLQVGVGAGGGGLCVWGERGYGWEAQQQRQQQSCPYLAPRPLIRQP
jgi:coatomer protein complex subunit alpha (xenin)